MISAPGAPDLTRLAGFGPLDVAANEKGALSDEQRSQLRRRILRDFAGLAIAGPISLAIASRSSVGLFVVLYGLALTYAALKLIWLAMSVRRSRVGYIEGDASLRLIPDSDGPDAHFLDIASEKLEITRDMYLQMRDGGPYRVFYLDGTRRVVSAVPMPGWRQLFPPPTKHKRRWNIEIGL